MLEFLKNNVDIIVSITSLLECVIMLFTMKATYKQIKIGIKQFYYQKRMQTYLDLKDEFALWERLSIDFQNIMHIDEFLCQYYCYQNTVIINKINAISEIVKDLKFIFPSIKEIDDIEDFLIKDIELYNSYLQTNGYEINKLGKITLESFRKINAKAILNEMKKLI